MKTTPAPIVEKSTGTSDGMIAAKTQCVEVPNDCPLDLKWFGKISDINTQITAPWPIACDAININKNMGTAIPPQFRKKAIETKLNDII